MLTFASCAGLDDDHLNNMSDFFALGMDSLKASQLRSRLLQSLYLGDNKLPTNVVFEHPNVAQLTRYLLNTRKGIVTVIEDAEASANALVDKYATINMIEAPGITTAESQCVVRPNHSVSMNSAD